jgi:hypothetical protein
MAVVGSIILPVASMVKSIVNEGTEIMGPKSAIKSSLINK